VAEACTNIRKAAIIMKAPMSLGMWTSRPAILTKIIRLIKKNPESITNNSYIKICIGKMFLRAEKNAKKPLAFSFDQTFIFCP
jgi:hypothetical protein